MSDRDNSHNSNKNEEKILKCSQMYGEASTPPPPPKKKKEESKSDNENQSES